MNRTPQIALALTGILLSLFAACSKRDKVINVEDNDPEMVSAIAKARDTLPQFWQVFDKPERGESGFSLLKTMPEKEAAGYRKMMAEP